MPSSDPRPDLSGERIRGLRRVEYDQMIEIGLFEDEPIELLYGQLVEMSSEGPVHSNVIEQLVPILAGERIRGLRRSEYDQMVEMGLLEDEPVELLHGQLVEMKREEPAHAAMRTRLTRLLPVPLGDRVVVRVGSPLAVSDDSEPEPDLAVVPPGDYRQAHPSTAFLVIEVSELSLRKDRRIKAPLYASAGVPEYWVVNLRERTLEVYRESSEGAYLSLTTLRSGDTVHLHAFPDIELSVADFME